MSGSYRNAFYTDPGLGRALSGLAAAFMPNPGQEARTQAALAGADLSRTQAAQIQGRMASGVAAGERLRGGSVDPSVLANVFADVLSGADPQMLQALPGFVRGFGAAAGADPDRLAQLFVGAGGNYGHTEPGFRHGVDTTAATARRGQDIGASTQRYAVDQQQAGLDRRMAPEINPGNVVVVPPNSPLAPRAGPDGRIAGDTRPQTFDQRRALEVDRYLAPPEGEDPAIQQRRREIIAPTVAGAEVRGPGAGRAPLDINGSDARAIDEQIAVNMPGGAALDQEAAALVRARTAELYQQSRNLPLAAQQAVQEFMARNPPRTDSSWNPLSSRTFGAPRAQPAPIQSGAPPAPAQPQAVPPAAQREVGRVYQTPRGPMQWTGSGWRPVT